MQLSKRAHPAFGHEIASNEHDLFASRRTKGTMETFSSSKFVCQSSWGETSGYMGVVNHGWLKCLDTSHAHLEIQCSGS